MSELLTVKDVAIIMKCSEDAVAHRFAKVPGVINLGRDETRKHRRYRVFRIPKTVLEKYLSMKAGHPIRVDVPPRPEKRRRSGNWENRAVLNLAKAALQNECRDRKTLRRIAGRARLLAAFVPEQQWSDVDWLPEEED